MQTDFWKQFEPVQKPDDIAAELYNAFLNGKAACLELWPIGMNPYVCQPHEKDLWLAWRAGWEMIECEFEEKRAGIRRLINFRTKDGY